jgi:biopolymer transport protein ExbD
MSSQNSETGEPNLTPVLDMVFQLITFFMLVINFKAASYDLSLKLPVIGSARPMESGGGKPDLLVLNIDSQGKLIAFGQEQEIDRFIAFEAQNRRDTLASAGQPLADGAPLPTTVVVRADKATSFKLVNRILKECQEHGYQSFSLRAMTQAEGGAK